MNWLVNGILGLLSYGLFGLFNKLSSGADNYATNGIVQLTFLALSLILLALVCRKKLRWSKDAFIAGICGAMGTWVVLLALAKNQLIIVYPFAALSSIVFITANFLVYHVTYKGKKLAWLITGLIVGCAGLFFAAIGGSGGLASFSETFRLDPLFLAQGFSVMLLWGLLAFFWFRARVVKKLDAHATLLWTAIGSGAISILMLILHPTSFTHLKIQLFPVLAGAAILGGSYFMLTAFGQTQTTSSIKNIILAILTNGEIIPITFFALIILKEFSVEGIIGSIASIIGIVLLNVADAVKN